MNMKVLLSVVIGVISFCSAVFAQNDCCQTKSAIKTSDHSAPIGKFDVRNFGTYKLHIYLTEDQMGDASFIIEGVDSLVTMEQPLFKVNAAIFDQYLASLAKPVAHRISDFHLGNTGAAKLIVPVGMPAVFKGPQYSGMMAHFAEQYGDAIVLSPTGTTEEIAFDATVFLAGVPFTFLRGASNDFPGANILIGKEVVYSHFAPAKAHTNAMYAGTIEGVDSRIAELERILATGASLFVGGHGTPATVDDVKFLIGYLKKVKELRVTSPDAESFSAALIAAYPNLSGKDSVAGLAKSLYSAQ